MVIFSHAPGRLTHTYRGITAFFVPVIYASLLSLLGDMVPVTAEEKAVGDPGPIKIEAYLTERTPREFEASVNIGDLAIESRQRVLLVLHNAVGQSVVRLSTEPQASCACVSISLSATEIQPGSSATANILLNVSGAQKSPEWFQTISFASAGEGSIVRIKLLGRVAGLLTVEPASFLSYVPMTARSTKSDTSKESDSVVTRELKVVVSPPVTIESLKITGPATLNLASIKIRRETDTTAALIVAVDPNNVPSDGLVLPITVMHEVSGRKVTVIGTFAAREEITVMPSAIRMIPQSDGTLQGTAILARRFDDDKQVESSKTRSLTLEATIDDYKLPTSVALLGDVAARVTITMPSDLAEHLVEELRQGEAMSRISWDIFWDDARVGTTTDCLFVE
jgi:hypothetical protein